MKKYKKLILTFLISGALALCFTACGGGGGSGGDGRGDSGAENSSINEIPVPSVWTCTWENSETSVVKFESETVVDDDGIPANWEYAPGNDGKTGTLTFTYLNANPQVRAIIRVTFVEKGRGNIVSTVYMNGQIYSQEAGTIRMQ